MPETSLDKFKKLLAELFMFDQADRNCPGFS